MQSSVRSATPRTVNAGSNSSHFSKNGQDVSSVSPRTNSLKELGNKSMGYWKPAIPPEPLRSHTSHGSTSSISALSLNRWNSESRRAAKARPSRHDPARAMLGAGALDIDLLESNRESMKALSDFLRTKAKEHLPPFCVSILM
jgi:hypothetical protein